MAIITTRPVSLLLASNKPAPKQTSVTSTTGQSGNNSACICNRKTPAAKAMIFKRTSITLG